MAGVTFSSVLETAQRVLWNHQKDGGQTEGRARAVLHHVLGADAHACAVTDLTAKLLARFASECLAERWSPATVNRHLSAVSALLSVARDYFEVPKIVVRLLPEGPGRKGYLTPQQVDLVARAMDDGAVDGRYGSLVLFLFATGLRLGEALRLRHDDVSYPLAGTAILSVRDTKNGSDRKVPCPARLLSQHLPLSAGKYLFSIGKRDFQRRFKEAAKRALGADCPPDLVPHSLRHSCASRLVATGTPLHVVSDYLGHRSMQTTRRYAHNATEALEAAAKNAGFV